MPKLSDNILVGSAFSYMGANIKDNTEKDKLDSNIYDLILYGSYAITPQNEVNFTSSFAKIKNSASRSISIGQMPQRVATSHSRGSAISVGANFTHNTNINKYLNMKFSTGIDYHYIRNGRYKEKSADSLSLHVRRQHIERLIPYITIGGHYDASDRVSLEASLGIACNILSGQSVVNAALKGINGTDTKTTSFKVEGLLQPSLSAQTGIAIVYKCSERISASLGYNGSVWSGDFSENTVYFRASIKI
ncbi:Autotransporter outer membrane beta-barrel domain-containing protein [Candidatus Cyrtobacter comes]|uniref:Autotransporter outer membrane beta-barrel domain-containing protein n=1 Tax=Candidatus Cyrtobacter comes TaxID=675776 RepID=A0ABU5L897_9RICK|nr:Autotransporter outer membrane beta-barrel domain-containing protein [Candidatus Cyrtobacter comes]